MKLNMNFQKLAEPLTKMANWVNNQKILQAIKNAFIRVVPFTLVASIVSIVQSIVTGVQTYFHVKYSWLTTLSNTAGYIYLATLGIVAIIVVVFVSYQYAIELKKDERNSNLNPIIATVTGLAAYFVSVPDMVDYATKNKTQGFSLDFFNYNGMFTGSLIALIGVGLFAKFSRSKFNIKMPDSVPENVFEAFFSLLPILEVMIIFAIFRLLIEALGYASLMTMVTKLLVKPLLGVTNGLPAIIIVIFIEQFLWFLGMHGFNVVWGVIAGLWLSQHFENIAIFARTHDFSQVHIIPYMFTNMYAMIGGSGSTFGLIIAMLLICGKGTKEREVAKLGLVPGIFFVNEPITFGMPIVLNPFMFIPWIVVPIVNATIAFFVTSWGWVVPLVEMNPGSSVPLLANYWIMSDFHFSPVVLAAFLIIIDIFMYAPFVKMHMNNEALLAENNE